MPKMKDVQPVNQKTVSKAVIVPQPPTVETNNMTMPTTPVYHNSHLLIWPTDHWGLTKDLKKAMIQIASKLNGHADKKSLFDATLEIGLKHIEAKFAEKNALNIEASKDDE